MFQFVPVKIFKAFQNKYLNKKGIQMNTKKIFFVCLALLTVFYAVIKPVNAQTINWTETKPKDSQGFIQIGPDLSTEIFSEKNTEILPSLQNATLPQNPTAPQNQTEPANGQLFETTAGQTRQQSTKTMQKARATSAKILIKPEQNNQSITQNIDSIEKALAIESVSVMPATGKIITKITNESGRKSIQEIQPELFPKIVQDGIEIKANPKEKQAIISQDSINAKTQNDLTVSSNGVFVSTENTKKQLNIFPVQAKQIVLEKEQIPINSSIDSFELGTSLDEPKYKFYAKKNGKLFFLFPVEFEYSIEVNAQTGQVKSNKPFWTIFVLNQSFK